jgi:hypothetical protein
MVFDMCLDPGEFYSPVLQLHLYNFLPDSVDEMCVVFLFLSDSNVIWLSVDTKTVLSLVSRCCKFCSASRFASCSAWLFEHRLSNLDFFLSAMVPSINMAIPSPTPCSLLLPSVYIWMACSLCFCPSVIWMELARWVQCFTSVSRSNWCPNSFEIA